MLSGQNIYVDGNGVRNYKENYLSIALSTDSLTEKSYHKLKYF